MQDSLVHTALRCLQVNPSQSPIACMRARLSGILLPIGDLSLFNISARLVLPCRGPPKDREYRRGLEQPEGEITDVQSQNISTSDYVPPTTGGMRRAAPSGTHCTHTEGNSSALHAGLGMHYNTSVMRRGNKSVFAHLLPKEYRQNCVLLAGQLPREAGYFPCAGHH